MKFWQYPGQKYKKLPGAWLGHVYRSHMQPQLCFCSQTTTQWNILLMELWRISYYSFPSSTDRCNPMCLIVQTDIPLQRHSFPFHRVLSTKCYSWVDCHMMALRMELVAFSWPSLASYQFIYSHNHWNSPMNIIICLPGPVHTHVDSQTLTKFQIN